MSFDIIIGNPPYNGGLYCKFLSGIGQLTTDTNFFDLLLPSYSFTRKKSRDVCVNEVRLTRVDLSVGRHFGESISGTWVARFTGVRGTTGTSAVELVLPDGVVTSVTLDDYVPTSEKFIKPNGLTVEDLSIVRKVLTSTIQCRPHKTERLSGSFAYIKPTLKYVGKPSPAAGSFTLHGTVNHLTSDIKNGWYVECSCPDKVYDIYTQSKLFNYVHWLMISDFPMVSRTYIESLPSVVDVSYETESDLYRAFGLSRREIERIESILTW